jgi:hypothetical protein
MNQLIEEYQNTPMEDRCFTDLSYALMRHIFSRLPDDKKTTSGMSEEQWEEHLMENLRNSSLSERQRDIMYDYTTSFYGENFGEE